MAGQNFDSDLKRVHFPSKRFESAQLSFNAAREARHSKFVFDHSNPMSKEDLLIHSTALPSKLHRPVSTGLMSRYTAVFDYIDTFLHLKADQDLESDMMNSNPMGPNINSGNEDEPKPVYSDNNVDLLSKLDI